MKAPARLVRLLQWLEGLEIRTQPAKAKAVADPEQRALEAVDRIDLLIEAEDKRYKRNVKALRTRLRKAKRSATYYERKRAGSPR